MPASLVLVPYSTLVSIFTARTAPAGTLFPCGSEILPLIVALSVCADSGLTDQHRIITRQLRITRHTNRLFIRLLPLLTQMCLPDYVCRRGKTNVPKKYCEDVESKIAG